VPQRRREVADRQEIGLARGDISAHMTSALVITEADRHPDSWFGRGIGASVA
jgi:hypothetical protein